MRLLIRTVAVLCIIVWASQGSAQQSTAIPVGTVAAELRPITKTTEFVGRVEAMERVEIRARVTGFLEEVPVQGRRFREGNDVLYRSNGTRLMPRCSRRAAPCWKRKPNYANATAQRGRTQELTKTDAASRALLDERAATRRPRPR